VTDPELVAHKLARIEVLVQELRTLARVERIRADVREQRFVEHTLQIAVQCALDVASHVVADGALGMPETNRDLFAILGRHGWIDAGIADRLSNMVGFRNVLVHEYDKVDLGVVEDAVRNRLDDLLAFAGAIRRRLPPAQGRV
jgi:uncharacterized protein YutE (UPF0331/DUF86 family)